MPETPRKCPHVVPVFPSFGPSEYQAIIQWLNENITENTHKLAAWKHGSPRHKLPGTKLKELRFWRAAIAIGRSCGLRLGDICQLEWACFAKPGKMIVWTDKRDRRVTLHSYRYAWAERALKCGYPERFAQQALGHNSKAVHHAYSKHAEVTVPSLDDWEKEWKKNPRAKKPKVVQVNFQQATFPGASTHAPGK